MKKAPSKKHLRETGDQLWRMAGVKMWGQRCICGTPAVHCHHYWYRSSVGHLRYDLDNFVPLCNSCHFLLHFRDPKLIEPKIVEARGKEWEKRLNEKAKEKPQSYQTVGWYKSKIEELKNYISK